MCKGPKCFFLNKHVSVAVGPNSTDSLKIALSLIRVVVCVGGSRWALQRSKHIYLHNAFTCFARFLVFCLLFIAYLLFVFICLCVHVTSLLPACRLLVIYQSFVSHLSFCLLALFVICSSSVYQLFAVYFSSAYHLSVFRLSFVCCSGFDCFWSVFLLLVICLATVVRLCLSTNCRLVLACSSSVCCPFFSSTCHLFVVAVGLSPFYRLLLICFSSVRRLLNIKLNIWKGYTSIGKQWLYTSLLCPHQHIHKLRPVIR